MKRAWLGIGALVGLLAGPAIGEEATREAPAAPAGAAPAPPLTPAPPDLESIALDLPLYRVPEAVYRVDSEDLDEIAAPELSEALSLRIPGVTRNPVQNNPFQDDLVYRGFAATPLLGAAIGISTYLDGARVNEAFGDTVNWDLIPEGALETAEIVSGPDALFGRNSLGGSLFLRTKTGFSFDGTRVRAETGTEDRFTAAAEHGGNRGSIGWYFHSDWLSEKGWRRRTRSDARRFFGTLSHQREGGDAHVSYRFARNDFRGNGLVPESVLRLDRQEVYTFPDDTRNTLHHISLRGSEALGDALALRANFFVRDYERETRNGDAELECEDAVGDPIDVVPALCEGAGGELEAEAEDRATRTKSLSWGGRLELGGETSFAGLDHAWVLGTSYESSRTRFRQSEAEADFVPEGRAFGTEQEEPFELDTHVLTRQRSAGLFARDVVALSPTLSLTLGARFDFVTIRLRDQTGEAENADLNGSHDFERFTGGVGLSYRPRPDLVLYASYREGWRAPTPAELSCADPDDPCNLPNAFVADPPLDEVKVGNAEVGARGQVAPLAARWSAAFYHTLVRDELLFVQSEVGGGGFFRNVDRTRRLGAEFQAVGDRGPVRWRLQYAWTDARYESFDTLASPVEAAGIAIEPGKRIPGIPAHALSGSVDVELAPWWTLGLDARYHAGQFLRGDDRNQLAKTPSYATLDLRSRWTLPAGIELYARVSNVLDRKIDIGGARNFNAFAQPEVREERFLAPGAPRRIWVGLRWAFP